MPVGRFLMCHFRDFLPFDPFRKTFFFFKTKEQQASNFLICVCGLSTRLPLASEISRFQQRCCCRERPVAGLFKGPLSQTL